MSVNPAGPGEMTTTSIQSIQRGIPIKCGSVSLVAFEAVHARLWLDPWCWSEPCAVATPIIGPRVP